MADRDIERTMDELLAPSVHDPVTRCVLDCVTLYASMDLRRIRLGLSWRAISRQLGVSASTFTRLKTGHPPHANVLCSIIWWMGYGFLPYVKPNGKFRGES